MMSSCKSRFQHHHCNRIMTEPRIFRHLSDIKKVLRIFVCCFLVIFAFSGHAHADSPAQMLSLTHDGQMSNLGQVSYITHSNPDEFTLDEILKRHNRVDLRGKQNPTNVVKIANNHQQSWIVFTIENQTVTKDWILHFGRVLDGRLGYAHQIYLYNHNSQYEKVYNFTEPSSFPFFGSAVPLTLRPGEKNLIVLRITSQTGFPLILSPQVKSSVAFTQSILKGDIAMTIAMFLFILTLTFFTASYYIGRNPASIAFLTYYSILCAIFFNVDVAVIGSDGVSNDVMFTLYIMGFISLIAATKFFNKIQPRTREHSLLFASGVLIVISSLVHFFMFGNGGGPLSVLACVILLPMLLCTLLSFSAHGKIGSVKLFFGLGMLLSVSPLGVMCLFVSDYIPTNQITVTLFWAAHTLSAVCFVVSYFRSSVNQRLMMMQWQKSKLHEEQSLARIKKSKESADQARLMRVIERERELMSELRERELMRTEEMRNAKDLADRANQAKSAFLAVVSHEIRTPMNGIMGMVQLLQNTQLSKTQNDYVDTIKRSGDTMVSLLNDILDFEKIERGSMDFEKVSFNLYTLANDVVTLMSGHAAQKGVKLTADIDPAVPERVEADPTRLRQVLFNLVNNAIKFTDEGSVQISLKTVKAEDCDDELIRFMVSDTGVGIPEHLQAHLFDPFAQAEASTTRKYGGSGLGLTISYRLIEAMGGVIKVDSTLGEGSRFYFDLCLNESDSDDVSADDANQHEPGRTKPMRILVTEDNPLNRKVLEGLLSNEGHTLFMAANGFEALDICRREEPDIILMDINMDGMDGIETTKRLRADEDLKISTIPVIALTGNVMLNDIEEYFEIGMNGFVAKPVDAGNLKDVLRNASLGNFENELPVDFFAEKTRRDYEEEDGLSADPDNPLRPAKTGLEHISHDFELDDREHFVADSELKSREASSNSLLQYAEGLSFEDDPISTPASDSKMPSPSEPAGITDIQPKTDPNPSTQSEPKPAPDFDKEADETDKKPTVPIASLSGTPPDVSPLQDAPGEDMSRTYTATEHRDHMSRQKKADREFISSLGTKKDEELSEVQKYLLSQLSSDDKQDATNSGETSNTPTPNEKSAEAPISDTDIDPVQSSQEPDSAEHQGEAVPQPEDVPSIKETETPESTAPKPEDHGADTDGLLDENMLVTLYDTLGEEQFATLLHGFVEKAESLIADIDAALERNDISTLSARAHDLKGMAGNFGMAKVSSISAEIERHSKLAESDDAVKHAKNLSPVVLHTKEALNDWLASR